MLLLAGMRLMGTMTSFFDAAGHPDGEHTLTVCGHVSEQEKWLKFETAWKRTLADVGIHGPFHMNHFMACQQSFKGWLHRTDDRAALLRALISIIKRNVFKAFSETVLLDDWRRVNEVYQLEELHCTPYALASFYVIDRTIRWWGRRHRHDSMNQFVFEDGDEHKGDFIWIMDNLIRPRRREFALISPIFKPKALVPLQAADLAGWIERRAFKAWLIEQPEKSIPPTVIDALLTLRNVPHLAGYLDKEKLILFCENHAVPKRGDDRRWAGVVRR